MIYGVSFLLFLIFFVLAFIAGFTLRVITKQRQRDLITIYSQGMVVIFLVFAACAELCAALDASVKFAGALWLSVIFVFEVFFIFVDRRRFPRLIKSFRKGFRRKDKIPLSTKAFAGIVILIIALQIFFAVNYAFVRPNAVNEISNAVLSYETGRVVRESPLMMLYAWLSDIVNVHPLTMIYTIAPVILLPMYYGLEWSLAKKLFKDDTVKCLYMLFIFELLHVFGYQSAYTQKTALLISYFTGTAFFVHAVLPLSLWFVLDALEKKEILREKEKSLKEQEEALRALRPPSPDRAKALEPPEGIQADIGTVSIEEFEEDWDMKHKIVNSRNLGILTLALAVLFVGAVFILNRKINSLHEAAAGITENLENSVRTYEYIPEGAETAEAYLLRQSGGSLVVIGGGAREYGDGLYDFISKYGDSVEAWYLKSGNEEDTGAYEVCKERGIKVLDTYMLSVEKYMK